MGRIAGHRQYLCPHIAQLAQPRFQRKNAEKLKIATVETAKESERGIVDIETLKATNESLIATFDEVMQIQQEGRQKRQQAEVEMQRIEAELKAKLLQVQG